MWKLLAALCALAGVGLIVAGPLWLAYGGLGTAGALGLVGLGFVGTFGASALSERAGRARRWSGRIVRCSACRAIVAEAGGEWREPSTGVALVFVCASCRRR